MNTHDLLPFFALVMGMVTVFLVATMVAVLYMLKKGKVNNIIEMSMYDAELKPEQDLHEKSILDCFLNRWVQVQAIIALNGPERQVALYRLIRDIQSSEGYEQEIWFIPFLQHLMSYIEQFPQKYLTQPKVESLLYETWDSLQFETEGYDIVTYMMKQCTVSNTKEAEYDGTESPARSEDIVQQEPEEYQDIDELFQGVS